jgi:hypothetical protein
MIGARLGMCLPDLREDGRLGDPEADIQPDRYEQETQEERDTPAPGQKLLLRESCKRGECGRREHKPCRGAHLWPAPEEAPRLGGGMLHRHEHRAAPLSPYGEAL